MATPDSTDAITPVDVEKALPTACPETVVVVESNGLDDEGRRQVEHTNEQLLDRAREINASGRFIFSCFSELNTFLILRAQDEILNLQNRLHDSVKGQGTWTNEDTNNLQKKLKQYRKPCFAIPH
jgi:hypothetical protein